MSARPADVNIGDVISIGPGASWRKVTDIHAPRHGLAAAYGGIVFELILWGDGRRMGPLTVFPDDRIHVVRTAAADMVTCDLIVCHDAPATRCRHCGADAVYSREGIGPAVHRATNRIECGSDHGA